MKIDHNFIRSMADDVRLALGDDFDQQTFLDTLDGETDAMEIIGWLIQSRQEAEAFAQACKAEADRYKERQSDMENRARTATLAIGKVLDTIGERKIKHPLGTVSRTKGRASVSITDETSVPTQLTKTTVKPDVSAIKKHLEAGEIVPGAELTIGPDSVMVRV